MTKSKTESFINNFYKTRQIENKNGDTRVISDCISEMEARVILRLVKEEKPTNTLEVGLAHGISACVICLSKKDMNLNGMHFAVDPNQLTDFESIGLNNILDNNLLQTFTHLNGPSHLKIPELINSGVQINFAFIDGWHTFDYTLIDFFLVDKILNVGGVVAFHDGYGRSKQKVFRFIESHRKYKLLNDEMHFRDNNLYKTLKMFIWRIYKDPFLIFSKYHWRFQLRRESGLYIFRKEQSFEPPYDFYKTF
jgi:hypothetical protein